jgi:hypothetical protein
MYTFISTTVAINEATRIDIRAMLACMFGAWKYYDTGIFMEYTHSINSASSITICLGICISVAIFRVVIFCIAIGILHFTNGVNCDWSDYFAVFRFFLANFARSPTTRKENAKETIAQRYIAPLNPALRG